MNALFSDTFTGNYVSLAAYAEQSDIRYTQDEILHAVYFNTWESYRGSSIDLTLFEGYMSDMGLSTEKAGQKTITGQEMSELLDSLVAWAAPEKLIQWQSMYPKFRAYTGTLTRLDAMASIFLAAQHIGGSFSDLAYSFDTVPYDMMELMRKDGDTPNMDIFGWGTFDLDDFSYDHCGVGAICYNIINFCPIDGSYPMSLDRVKNAFRMDENATYSEAMGAMLRVAAVRSGGWVSVDDPAVVTLTGAITPAHIAKAQAAPEFTAENRRELQGFMGGAEYSGGTFNTPEDMILTANWGFNAYCLRFDHIALFDENIENVNLNTLAFLDGMVATAIENNLHLCLATTTLPGRWAAHSTENYSSAGEFDLFINPEKQVLANRVWAIIAERYKDIPSANLSFWPTWESGNKNLSTGLPAPDYTAQDVANYISSLTDVIRSIDPDRIVSFETGVEDASAFLLVMEEKGNMQIMTDIVEAPFVYAAMTGEEGAHIDNNNHSLPLPEYPTYYYALTDFVDLSTPIILEGLLPEGTVINIYMAASDDMTLDIYGDDTLLHSEKLKKAQYQVGYLLSGMVRFAASDRLVTVTLPETVDAVKITPAGDNCFSWSGIEVILPEAYAQEKWYDITNYDVFLGIEEEAGMKLRKTSTIYIYPSGGTNTNVATIHDDLTFTTAQKEPHFSNREGINKRFDDMIAIKDNWLVRFEDATFCAMIWEEVREYYTDVLQGFYDHGISWLSNDWDNITTQSPAVLAGSTTVEYMGYSSFNLELLQLLQSFQK